MGENNVESRVKSMLPAERGSIITAAMAAHVGEAGRNATVAYMEGAGHRIRRERFDRYLDAVKTFMAGLE
jgi:hypothetical protein